MTGPCAVVIAGDGWDLPFLYQVMSPVVKQCDRKSVQLWCLSSVLCPSTFSSEAHLKCPVCSGGWLILRRTSCMMQVPLQINISRCAESPEVRCWLSCWTHRLQHKLWQNNSVVFCLWGNTVSNILPCHTHVMTMLLKTHSDQTSANAPQFVLILFIETQNVSSLQQLPWRRG